ncbi:unnamed protein product [Ilex paraguariensis]|uniref:S1 motif domain-containing protein n=1 Tax=Ilex paraguariensis TaxID=185542 RepID=A0ABC8RB05_9AQUA
MDGLALTTATTTLLNSSTIRCFVPSFSRHRRYANLSFPRKPKKLIVFASKDDPNLDQWDQMELKFGRLLGEDPKLTLAKIMGRKSNPDMSSLDIEKLYDKNKGEVLNNEEEEVPFNLLEKGKSVNSLDGLNLARPVPKKGVKFQSDDKPMVSRVKKPSPKVSNEVENTKKSVPNVILRKPTMFEDDDGMEKSSRLRIKPNLSLKMGKEQNKERFSDMTLLKKPEPVKIEPNLEENSSKSVSMSAGTTNDVALLEKPELNDVSLNTEPEQKSSVDCHLNSGNSSTNLDQTLETENLSLSKDSGPENDSVAGLQMLEQTDIGSAEKSSATNGSSERKLADSSSRISVEAALQGKPKKLDHYVKGASNISREQMVLVSPESYGNFVELQNFLETSPIKESEDIDWTRAENLIKTEGRVEVELISSSTRGFVVSFGSLIGILPYRNLAAKWKFLAFESWLRKKGLDPSRYKQNLGIIGSYEAASKTSSLGSSIEPRVDHRAEGEVPPDMKLEDLLRIYDQEKLKFLSSFVGQKIRVSVVLADRKSRRLIFSVKPKEKEELIEKKRNLMAKLSIGDVVKCCIKKITYFGIFVEVEGVPALIHQTEVSWDTTLDPASYFKIGQIVEAKVHQIDFSLERIFLSLKEITPDPLIEALEVVVGDNDSLDGRLEVAREDTKWDEVESIIQELQQVEGILSVSKGRFFLSPGLAPTFQVYMASMFENQYKLLVRSGNKIQEVIVQTTLGKEEMKSAILTCTNRWIES